MPIKAAPPLKTDTYGQTDADEDADHADGDVGAAAPPGKRAAHGGSARRTETLRKSAGTTFLPT